MVNTVTKKQFFIVGSVLLVVLILILGGIYLIKNNKQPLTTDELGVCYDIQKKDKNLSDNLNVFCYKDISGQLRISKTLPKIQKGNFLAIIINTPRLFSSDTMTGLPGGNFVNETFMWRGGVNALCVGLPNVFIDKTFLSLPSSLSVNSIINNSGIYMCSDIDKNKLMQQSVIFGGRLINNPAKTWGSINIYINYATPVHDNAVEYFINHVGEYTIIDTINNFGL